VWRGRTYQFPGLPGTDLNGAAGVRGDVNNHTALVFGRATLLSLIGAGAKLSQPTRSRTSLTLTDRELLTSSVADQLNAAAAEYLNRAVNIAPTISVPAGTSFKVLLPYNLTLSPLEATP
jgi:type IV secretion system protein VirB10